MPVPHALQPAVQVPEVVLQFCTVSLLSDPIDADRRVVADPVIGPPQRPLIEVVRQRQQPSRVPPRCLRYPHESR